MITSLLYLSMEQEMLMFPWYIDAGLLLLVLAGFSAIWVIPGRDI